MKANGFDRPFTGTITMNCIMHEVEIILVDDAISPENSQALILSFNIDLKADAVTYFIQLNSCEILLP